MSGNGEGRGGFRLSPEVAARCDGPGSSFGQALADINGPDSLRKIEKAGGSVTALMPSTEEVAKNKMLAHYAATHKKKAAAKAAEK